VQTDCPPDKSQMASDIFVTKESKDGDPTCTIDFVEMKKAGKPKVTIVKVTGLFSINLRVSYA
jgi:hypothetical protein